MHKNRRRIGRTQIRRSPFGVQCVAHTSEYGGRYILRAICNPLVGKHGFPREYTIIFSFREREREKNLQQYSSVEYKIKRDASLPTSLLLPIIVNRFQVTALAHPIYRIIIFNTSPSVLRGSL